MKKNILNWFTTEGKEWIESFLVALVLALFIRAFFIQAFKIPSGSMRMTLIEGDKLIVNKLVYGPRLPFTKSIRLPGFSSPKRGDVIVFKYPIDPKKDFIKRLIGFAGEQVQIKDGDIYVNGELIKEPSIKNIFYYNKGTYGQEGQTIRVPDGHVFVLGDNSGYSSDSRIWGFVPVENIVGKAEIIYLPFNRIRKIK